MHSAYLIRHGNVKSYGDDQLSEIGRRQVFALNDGMERKLPDNEKCALVISGSGRTTKSGEIILPMLERKSGSKVQVYREPMLSQTRSMGSDDTIISNGKENAKLIDMYSERGDHVFFVSHEYLLVCTANAIGVEQNIELPPNLRLKEYEESHVRMVMEQLELDRKAAIAKVLEWGFGPTMKIPPVAEGSALYFDLVNRRFDYIVPDIF